MKRKRAGRGHAAGAGQPYVPTELAAVYAFGALAAIFVCQPETFPVFKRWADSFAAGPLELDLAGAREAGSYLTDGMLTIKRLREEAGR